MAGQPITRAHYARLTKMEDELMDRLAGGAFVTHLCRELGMGSTTFYDWINSDPERKERFQRVRADSAHAHVEKSFDVLEEAHEEGRALTAAQASVSRARADSHRWVAGKLNSIYSDKVTHEVDVDSFADAFRNMLIEVNKPQAGELAASEPEAIEAEYTIEDETQTEDEGQNE